MSARLRGQIAVHNDTGQVLTRTRLELDMRDDPLMRLDEFRLLSGPAENDVTEKYAA